MVAQSGFTHNSQLQELIERGRQHAANIEADRRNAAAEVPQPPPTERVTLPDLYRRAYGAAQDSDIDSDGMICALLAVAVEIRSLRVALDGRLDLLCESGTGYAGEPLAALRVSNMQ